MIAIIIMVVAAASTIALSIITSANTIVDAYEEKYDYEASIEMDRSSVMKNLTDEKSTREEKITKFSEIPTLTSEEVESYGDSKYLEKYYYTYSVGVNAKDLEEAADELEKTTTTTTTTKRKYKYSNSGENMPPGGSGVPPSGASNRPSSYSETKTTKTTEMFSNPNALNGAFTLVGYSSYEGMKEFVEGNYTITSGSVSSDFNDNSCVINEELATLNSLKVGDTITVINPNNTKLTYDLVITGIYKDNKEESNEYSMYTESVNNIITNVNFVKKLKTDDDTLKYNIIPTYILKDKDSADAFAKEVGEKGLSEYYKVVNNVEELGKQTESITNIKTFAETFLIITLVIGVVVLLVINMINVRERKYEIGVLRTIGMSKFKVISQFVLELMIVSVVGLLLGAGIGAYTSVPVANKLLEQEISNQEKDNEDIMKNFGDFEGMPRPDMKMNGVSNINQVSEINAVVNTRVLAKLLIIGLFLTIVSSLSAMISIANFSPLTILKERS